LKPLLEKERAGRISYGNYLQNILLSSCICSKLLAGNSFPILTDVTEPSKLMFSILIFSIFLSCNNPPKEKAIRNSKIEKQQRALEKTFNDTVFSRHGVYISSDKGVT
jgi:hypothetical protein